MELQVLCGAQECCSKTNAGKREAEALTRAARTVPYFNTRPQCVVVQASGMGGC